MRWPPTERSCDRACASRGQDRRERVRLSLTLVSAEVLPLLGVDPGFAPDGVLTLRTALARPKYDSPVRRGEFYDRVLTAVRALPGVESAAFTSGLPMMVTGLVTGVEVPGQEPARRRDAVSHRWVTPQYFRAMGIGLLGGRDVEDADVEAREWVAVISKSFAERYWPGQDPIGRVFRHGDRTRTVVGVVRDIRVRGLERRSEPQLYLPARQAFDRSPGLFDPKDLVVRHVGPNEPLIAAIRQIVRAANPDQPISDVRTLGDVLAGETESRRGQLRILGLVAIVALVLAGVGLYGLLAYAVTQRSSEISVRLALGAEPAQVGRMIFADGMRLSLVGVACGGLVAYLAVRSLSSLLFGISPGDLASFGVAIGLVLLIGGAGALVPALRAVRVPPVAALRAE